LAKITGKKIDPPADGPLRGLSPEVLPRIKKATVYIRVHAGDGSRGSGTGFFGVNGNMVLTNAHVVGMNEKGALPPKKVEVVLNSGQRDEFTALATVVVPDAALDLAVLKLQGSPPPGGW